MKLLTTLEAAKKLDVARSRIYQLINEGTLTAEKIGRDYLIKEKNLENVTTYGKPGRPPKDKGEK